jgi:hypothetical protein
LEDRRQVKKDPSLRRVAIGNRVQQHRVTQAQERNKRRFGVPLSAPVPVAEEEDEVIVIEDKTLAVEAVDEPTEAPAFDEPAATKVKEQEFEHGEETTAEILGSVEEYPGVDKDYGPNPDDSMRFDHELALSLSLEEAEDESRHGPRADNAQVP